MRFHAPIPDHHLFKGKLPQIVKIDRPFVVESQSSGLKKVVYVRYIVEYSDKCIEIWQDQDNNIWINDNYDV